VNTTTRPNYTQPALIGGVVMGVLSALPIISVGNACCCLWVVSGGVLAAYLFQQNQAAPIESGDGALVGMLAGLVGAVVQSLVKIPIDILVAPMEQAMVQRLLDMGTLPPEVRDMLDRYGGGGAMGGLLRHQPHRRPDVLGLRGRHLLDARRPAGGDDLPQADASRRRRRTAPGLIRR
jgi:hypothetical protein